MYNIVADPSLGVGMVALRRIPCNCVSCITKQREPWKAGLDAKEQKRYEQNNNCELHHVFGALNDWNIVSLVAKAEADDDELDEAKADVLSGISSIMALGIQVGNYGALMTEDDNSHGYYLFQFLSSSYTLQEDRNDIQSGELMADVQYFQSVGRARHWYILGTYRDTAHVQHMVSVNAQLLKEDRSQKIILPRSCNQKEARRRNARRISDDSHQEILDEINRRDRLDFIEGENGEYKDDNDDDDEHEDSSDDDE